MTNSKIILARHLTGSAIVLLAMNPAYYAPLPFWAAWIGAIAVVWIIAAGIAGLAWLFFTSKMQGKLLQSFTSGVWVVTFLELYGQWHG